METVIRWDTSCSVGVAELDEEHRHLFAIGNRAAEIADQPVAADALRETLDELIDYAEHHLRHEEELMAQTRYPGIRKHRRVHKELMNEAYLYKSRFIAGDFDPADFSSFLHRWIVQHTKAMDKLYGAHLNAAGVN